MEHKNNSEAIWPNDVMRAIDSVLKTNFESWYEVLESIVDNLRFEWDASKWIPTYTITESLGLLWENEDQFNKITSLIAFVEKKTQDIQNAENYLSKWYALKIKTTIIELQNNIRRKEEEINNMDRNDAFEIRMIQNYEKNIEDMNYEIKYHKNDVSKIQTRQKKNDIIITINRLKNQLEPWKIENNLKIENKIKEQHERLIDLIKISSYTMLDVLHDTLKLFPEEMQTRYQRSKELWQNFWETK